MGAKMAPKQMFAEPTRHLGRCLGGVSVPTVRLAGARGGWRLSTRVLGGGAPMLLGFLGPLPFPPRLFGSGASPPSFRSKALCRPPLA
jgi:hypothetical protein